MHPLAHAVAFALAPAVAMVVGGTIAAFWPPTDTFKSYIQHFAAGIVFSALAVEVLPDVMHRDAPLAAALGFSLGLVVMLAIRRAARGTEGGTGTAETRGVAWRLLAVVGVDVFVDGLLIGVMLATGNRAGALVTLALAIELFSLGLAVAAASTAGRTRTILTIILLSTSTVLGAAVGSVGVGGLQGRWMEGVLGFAVAALLYLVTEELLVEAHEVPETRLSTAAFFIGFLAGLDPVWWTQSERRIRCPQWQTRNQSERDGASPKTTRPGPSDWSSMRARRSRRSRGTWA